MLLITQDLKIYLRSLGVFLACRSERLPAEIRIGLVRHPSSKERFSPRLSSASPPECGRVAEVTRQAGMTPVLDVKSPDNNSQEHYFFEYILNASFTEAPL